MNQPWFSRTSLLLPERDSGPPRACLQCKVPISVCKNAF